MPPTTINITVVEAESKPARRRVRVEVWDKDLVFDDLVASATTDRRGRCRLFLEPSRHKELFADRRPDVFFKVFDGEKLVVDTRDFVVCNLKPGTHDVVIRVPTSEPECTEPDESPLAVVRGRAIVSPGWEAELVIEAFADAELTQPVGTAKTDHCGNFGIVPKNLKMLPQTVWLRWSQGKEQGRSPKLQPFSTESAIRLHVYRRSGVPSRGTDRFEAFVRSESGRAAIGMRVALLEVSLRRCQVVGEALTNERGAAVIAYDRNKLFVAQPDLRVIVFDPAGTPLVESKSNTVVLSGVVARTATTFDKVNRAFREEGLSDDCDRDLSAHDVLYLVERTGLPVQSVAAYAAASALAPELGVPTEALYALAKSDGPDIAEGLEQAVARDLASPELLERSAQLVPVLAKAGRKAAATEDLGRGSLDEFLATQIGDAAEREELAGIILDAGRLSAIRARLAERPQLATPHVRFLVDLQSIVGVDVGIARVLGSRNNGPRTGEDLALLGIDAWVEILQQAQAEGDGAVIRARAAGLRRRAQRTFPEKVFRGQLDGRGGAVPWAARLSSYLEKHPDHTFRSPLPLPGTVTDDDPAEVAALVAYRRMVGLTADHPLAARLLDAGITSAPQLATLGHKELFERFAEAADGDVVVLEEIHERAMRKTAALHYASSFLPVGPRPSLCDCADCKSIFGPAAYLFELLSLFRQYSLLAHLDERRPDLTRTHLSCPNTTIEVPQVDLVNEILEDRILAALGMSVPHGLPDGACLPANRQTQETSDERRAVAQNQPAAEIVSRLAAATFPWTLPYDYHHDRARSARERLVAKPEDVALILWRSAVAAGSTTADATRALASGTLDLGPARTGLIAATSSLAAVWSAEVVALVATGEVSLDALRRAAATDYATLEDVLDTGFVRGARGSELSIHPESFCESGEEPRLTGPVEVLTGVLDRLHRFERLRRHVGWTAHDLDGALQWLGGLDADRLERIGLLRFLERRLRVSPGDLLVLFRDPDPALPATLRPRRVSSPFEIQFGVGTSTFEVPDMGLEDHERVQSLTAQIARASGASVAVVELAFVAGLLAPATTAVDVLALPAAEMQAAYRRAVSAAFRVSLWARQLRLDDREVLELAALGGVSLASTSLEDAVRLVDLADRIAGWSVEVSALRYLVGDDPASLREHGPSASATGAALMDLRQQIARAHEATKPLPDDPRAAVRAALGRLITAALPAGAITADVDALALGLAGAFEWSAFFPTTAVDADAFLANAVREWSGIAAVPAPDPAAREADLTAALASIETQLDDWLGQVPGAPAVWPATELEAVGTALESAVRGQLADPAFDAAASVRPSVDALFAAAGVTVPPGLSARLVVRAIEHVDAELHAQLTARADSFLPVLEGASRRLVARQVLADWISARFQASAEVATAILDELAMVATFVDEHGAISSPLAASVVNARYLSTGGELLAERDESTLVFDWSVRPPLPALQGRAFAVELEVRVPGDELGALVIEADGTIDVEVVDSAGPRSILHATPGDQVQRLDAPAATSDPEVLLRIRYATPVTGGARVVRALTRSSDGILDELPWAVLSPEVQRLQRSAIALRDTTIPPALLDLDHLAGGAPLADWFGFFALAELSRRVLVPDGAGALVAVVSGDATPRAEWRIALNLEEPELHGFLELLDVADGSADPVAMPTGVGFERLRTLLALVDEARRFNLPATALARWNEASSDEIYTSALAALRVGLEPVEWSAVRAQVHDPVREHLRDAQLDYLVGQGTFASREAIADELLTDVQMSACMTTSRIQFSYAAVQRYVEAGQAGRAPWLEPGDEEPFARRWVSMRQYRLHEAQMRILVHAENWIDPAIRPTKTPAFERLEQTMSSGPLTLHLAERAVKEYAASLAEIARLETVAIVTHDRVDTDRPLAFRDSELHGTHVFARTRAQPQRLYYRRRLPEPDGRWTPWERIDADLEGTHYVAVVVFGRLRLICADFSAARQVRQDECRGGANGSEHTPVGEAALTAYEVTLSWIDREDGRWSSIHRSARFPFSIEIANPPDETLAFGRGLPAQFGEVEREVAKRIENITVVARFGADGMETHLSTMATFLKSDTQDFQIGTFAGPISGGQRSEVDRSSGIPDHLEDLSRIRLEWDHRTDLDTDDWDVDWLRVQFAFAGGGSHVARVPEGRKAQFVRYENWLGGGGEVWEDVTLQGDQVMRFQGGHGETSWQVFEGALVPPLSLGNIEAAQEHFEIEYEIVPQSLDLSSAVAIQAANTGRDSFDLHIYSVPHQQKGRMRARFRVTDDALEENPELEEAWGSDWVTGPEFCYTFQTEHDGRASLRVYPDDTIELRGAPAVSLGEHMGTTSQGQSLVSLPQEPFASYPVYCDDRRIARGPARYTVTVERDSRASTRLSSAQSPKILDEMHGFGEPARTFFIERQDETVSLTEPEDPFLAIPELPPAAKRRLRESGFTDPIPFERFEEIVPLPNANDGLALKTYIAGSAPLDLREVNALERWVPGGTEIGPVTDRLGRFELVGSVWRFFTFWHPQAVAFRRILEARGLPRLVRVENQMLDVGTDLTDQRARVDHFSAYNPTHFVDPRWPRDVVDFTITGAFSEYNWELFFDSLLYIAQRFDEEGQFDDADEIFALLVDRTRVAEAGVWLQPTLYQTAPLRAAVALEQSGVVGLFDGAELREEILAQIERIRQNPYQPHLIARGWPAVYARALRIRYAEHLIRAGESDFRRAYAGDNRTYLESASMRFDLAARVLGPAEGSLAAALEDEIPCYASLTHGAPDEPTEGIEALEPYLPDDIFDDGSGGDHVAGSARWHFCVPRNDKLDELRALVADRLLKLRSCQDIDGVHRALSLYGRRIDPALLVRATADGLDLDVLLGRISSAKPSMYFHALWQRAMQACERARSLEDGWFGAQERADAEELTRLQNDQELRTLEGQLEVASQRLDDARALEEALARALESAEVRKEFYASRERLNAQEAAEGKALVEAGKADGRAAGDSRAASDWAWIPTAEIYADVGVQNSMPVGYVKAGLSTRYRLGGETGVQVYRSNAEGHGHEAAAARVEAGLMGREGSFARRTDEWKLQEALAVKDIQKGDHDLAGAKIRVQIAELELDLHRKRIDDTRAVRDFLRDKLTSHELQAWRADRFRALRYQQHRIAYDLVSQAQAALVREHGLEDQGYVRDPWDASRHGVAASAGLIHELEKQQQLYMETWRREQEKLKAYSLVERDPLAFLELIQRGEAVFTVDESDYDEDGPGDYFRRIRQISLDIPAVRGPYTNVNARLTQLRGEVRVRAQRATDAAYDREGPSDPRFRDDLANGESIATNSGLQDDGRLDQRQDGENPPSFCMNGAVGTFRIELPASQNHFDRQTVTDVITRIAITSRPGGEAGTDAAVQARRIRLMDRPRAVMLPLHSAFSNAWYRFVDALAAGGSGELVMGFEQAHIPLWLQPTRRIVQSSIYLAIPTGERVAVDGGDATAIVSVPPELQPLGSAGDPHVPPPIHRWRLAEPMRIGQERRIGFSRQSAAVNLKRGWLVCWLEGSGPE